MENLEQTKIALMGTCCSGKTTLLEHLKKGVGSLQGVTFVREAARDYFEQYPTVPRRTLRTQGAIQEIAHYNEMQAQVSGAKIIICDRSVLDAAVYMRHYGDELGARILYNRMVNWIPTYQRLFLLDPEGIPFVQDSVRNETQEERTKIHESYLSFFEDFEVPHSLLSGLPGERLKTVIAQLGL
jgi:predicted ATPase